MKYRKKPVVIDAVQWDGEQETWAVITGWMQVDRPVRWLEGGDLSIETLEGSMRCRKGKDWVIKGVAGELYPCKPDIFEATYETVG